ncbi:hypothetical protein COEREDRAFT_90098 [Coemansia reversa NRRL 1564]|uniref:Uncharacterized protein n=1 Tax=Coemansia reversa (strain ATCC 12441 / NRRL 1564) TaxID=763665 RepID=A0A2G5B121_COERN|nr:hypothetical protein COEREDRAFT_90098 [Coemansia reversa NRRL 1564]|eukprot:PIA12718.1 hypothetical protein COEREDRAFT_90098 [Coemansia reversa NRRL 1564]
MSQIEALKAEIDSLPSEKQIVNIFREELYFTSIVFDDNYNGEKTLLQLLIDLTGFKYNHYEENAKIRGVNVEVSKDDITFYNYIDIIKLLASHDIRFLIKWNTMLQNILESSYLEIHFKSIHMERVVFTTEYNNSNLVDLRNLVNRLSILLSCSDLENTDFMKFRQHKKYQIGTKTKLNIHTVIEKFKLLGFENLKNSKTLLIPSAYKKISWNNKNQESNGEQPENYLYIPSNLVPTTESLL